MTYKLKISKQGYNAITDTNNDHLIFSSDYGTLKYFTSGSITLTVNYANYYYSYYDNYFGLTYYYHEKIDSINHNLGYYPFFIVYYNNNGNNYLLSYEAGFVGTGGVQLNCYVDTNKLYFRIRATTTVNSGIVNYTFVYKLFKNNTGL